MSHKLALVAMLVPLAALHAHADETLAWATAVPYNFIIGTQDIGEASAARSRPFCNETLKNQAILERAHTEAF